MSPRFPATLKKINKLIKFENKIKELDKWPS